MAQFTGISMVAGLFFSSYISSVVFIEGRWSLIGSAARKNDKEQHMLINNNNKKKAAKENNKFVIISVLDDICNKQPSIKKLLKGRMN